MNATASLDPAPQLPRPSRHVPLPLMLDNCIRPPPLLLLPGPGLAWPCPWTSDAAIPLVTTSGPALLLFLSAQGLLVETPAVEHLARTVEHFFFFKKKEENTPSRARSILHNAVIIVSPTERGGDATTEFTGNHGLELVGDNNNNND